MYENSGSEREKKVTRAKIVRTTFTCGKCSYNFGKLQGTHATKQTAHACGINTVKNLINLIKSIKFNKNYSCSNFKLRTSVRKCITLYKKYIVYSVLVKLQK